MTGAFKPRTLAPLFETVTTTTRRSLMGMENKSLRQNFEWLKKLLVIRMEDKSLRQNVEWLKG